MTNAAIEKQLARMRADINELKKSVKTNAVVEKARAKLRAMVLEGLESEPGVKMDAAYWKKLDAFARRKKIAK